MDDPNYETLPHDELLKLADTDSMAAAEFFYRYQYSDDPALKTEVHSILKSLAEDFELTGFWLDWYAALRDSADPRERVDAEVWKRKILDDGGFDTVALLFYGVIDADELPDDELLEMPKDDLLVAKAFYNRFRNSDNPKIKIEVRTTLKALAEGGMIGYWPEWFCTLRDSDDMDERAEAEYWRQRIIKEDAWDKEVLIAYGIVEDNESVR